MAGPPRGRVSDPSVPVLEHADVRGLSPEHWRARLLASVDAPVQHGRRYPGFPDESTQRSFVGSAFGDALDEAWRFYTHLQPRLDRGGWRGRPGRYLDFGCGWGRIGRFFLREFERGDMAGVDVDPSMIAFCREAAAPGGWFAIDNRQRLPFQDGAFKLVTAYSVFTHLPPDLFGPWMSELLRVTAAGGLIAFTTEPPRFLDFVAGIDTSAPESGWHAALAAQLGDGAARRAELARTGCSFLPTGGGAHRAPDVYGDMVVTPDYISRAAEAGGGRLVEHLDDPGLFWQAVNVVRRGGGPARSPFGA